VTKKRNWSPF